MSNNWDDGRKRTLVFVYYAGHGVMDNTVFAVCNGGPRRTKYLFGLQAKLVALS